MEKPLRAVAGARLFDGFVEEQQFLNNFDIFALAGKNTAYVYTQLVTLTDGELNIRLEPVLNDALVNAIELEPYLDYPDN
jgi:hypothetical protein